MKQLGMVAIAIGVLLSGCATTYTSSDKVTGAKPAISSSQKEAWSLILGKWYMKQPAKDGGIQEEIMERESNGTYKATFKIHKKNGEVFKQVEVGHWGVSGPVYFTIFRGWLKSGQFTPSDPSDPYNDDAYRIITLTKDAFEYESFTDGNHYVMKKVPADFDFPN